MRFENTILKKDLRWILLLAVQIFWSFTTESAFGIVLAWDPSPDTNVVGYAVYCGTNSGSYQTRLDVGNQTNATVQVPANGATYFFVVTSYRVGGVESLPSNEVSYTPLVTSTNVLKAVFVNANCSFPFR